MWFMERSAKVSVILVSLASAVLVPFCTKGLLKLRVSKSSLLCWSCAKSLGSCETMTRAVQFQASACD